MFKANGSLLGQLESDGPRLFGVDPIVRYFPPTPGKAPTADVDEPKDGGELDDSDDDICFGPITYKELRKASILVKNRCGKKKEKSAVQVFCPQIGRFRLFSADLSHI